jgi:hypothetical protein
VTYIDASQVQQWLETTKLGVDQVDTDLEESASTYVFGRISDVTDSTSWVDAASTPALIRVIISMLVAAWMYERTYSESTSDQPSWGQRLQRMVERILDGIANGTIGLIDDLNPMVTDTIAFLPDDSTGSSTVYDALGRVVGQPGSEDIKFTMGTKF